MTVHRHEFSAIGCEHTILTLDPTALAPAGELAETVLAELDMVASRFRPDSEVSRIAEVAADGDVVVVVSPLLGGCIEAALHAADITDGVVDPTVGRALVACGYDADLAVVRRRAAHERPGEGEVVSVVPGWRTMRYDPGTRVLAVPSGSLLDLGATAKAFAADVIAARLAQQLPGGFLVNLGGDIAVSGELPGAGWEIGVADHQGVTRQVVVSTGQAVATSSTQVRTWTHGSEKRHHILDPCTGRTAASVWAQVSCAGTSAVEANAASTAAIILGADAPAWLQGCGIPARLDAVDGSVVVTPGWPTPESRAA
ncbi:MAG: FAD:protein FMN transferase [Dermatophilaceae bacterium]